DQSALHVLAEARVVAAPILPPEAAVRQPYVQQRGLIHTVPHPLLGALDVIAMPYRFSDAAIEVGRAPLQGEHTRTILAEHLGLSEQAIDDLLARSVLFEGAEAAALPDAG